MHAEPKINPIMMYITRREHFNAAHRLFREDFSDDQNLEVFGKCSNPNWHGHNYVLLCYRERRSEPSNRLCN
jgi:6-pyruvoyl-tetrahydropterin synthase